MTFNNDANLIFFLANHIERKFKDIKNKMERRTCCERRISRSYYNSTISYIWTQG